LHNSSLSDECVARCVVLRRSSQWCAPSQAATRDYWNIPKTTNCCFVVVVVVAQCPALYFHPIIFHIRVSATFLWLAGWLVRPANEVKFLYFFFFFFLSFTSDFGGLIYDFLLLECLVISIDTQCVIWPSIRPFVGRAFVTPREIRVNAQLLIKMKEREKEEILLRHFISQSQPLT